MSTGGAVGAAAFRAAYSSALADYLGDRSEDALRIAYELGREAVSRRLSVLDLAIAHQEALGSALESVSGSTGAQAVTSAAGDFFLESLSSFEMVQRGFQEAQEAARLERRQTEMARQLSTFLADASLAVDASDSLEEVLQLVAEQARELMDADCCFATVAAPGQPRAAEATSRSDTGRRWTAFLQWLDLFAVYRIIRLAGGSVRIADHQLAALAPFRSQVGNRRLKGWLAATLTALDGSELGAIQLFDKQDGAFTESDEAVLVHLAQMASAAVERARLYQEHV
jgi:hypothetical protein